MANDKYTCFKDLDAAEKRGEDYDFESRPRDASGVVVIAPHGGKIEPWAVVRAVLFDAQAAAKGA